MASGEGSYRAQILNSELAHYSGSGHYHSMVCLTNNFNHSPLVNIQRKERLHTIRHSVFVANNSFRSDSLLLRLKPGVMPYKFGI